MRSPHCSAFAILLTTCNGALLACDSAQSTELPPAPTADPLVFLEIIIAGNVFPVVDSVWLPEPGDSVALRARALDAAGHVTIDSQWDGLEWTLRDPQFAQMRGAHVHAMEHGSTHVYARVGDLVDSLVVTVGAWPGAGADVALVALGNAPEVFAMDTSAMTATSAFGYGWFPMLLELSPDGNRLLYGGDQRDGRYLFLFDLRTRTAHYLAPPANENRAHPLNGGFSPAGDRLAYTEGSTLRIAAPNGAEPLTVASDVSTMSWSADGHLVYVRGLQEVWVLAPGAALPERLSISGIGGRAPSHAQLSHDGTRLLLVTEGELMVREADGSLTAMSSARTVNDAHWLPDGRIVYDTEFETDEGVYKTLHTTDGSNDTELLAPGREVFAYDVSAAGMILYCAGAAPVGAYTLAPDGDEKAISDGYCSSASWAQ